jgi:hypothetical protein
MDNARQADQIRVIRANSLFKDLSVAAAGRAVPFFVLSVAFVVSTAQIEHAHAKRRHGTWRRKLS